MGRLLYAAFLTVLPFATAFAEPAAGWMNDDDIRIAFDGVTIDGIYSDRTTFTESYLKDGRITYRDTLKQMTGRWSVVEKSFCTIYDGFVSGGCFKVTRHSANCYEFYFLAPSEVAVAGAEPENARWTARGWNKDKAATCDEKPAV